MSDHYFSQRPQSEHELRDFSVELRGKVYHFQTDASVFSKRGLDKGSELLIKCLAVEPGQRVLDLGCGYGPIGIVAADLASPSGEALLVDINERAVQLANENIMANNITNAVAKVSDGCANVEGKFDWIITNPPIRAGKKVIYQFVEDAFDYLKTNGGFMVVIRTKQGAKSMEKKMEEVFSNVTTVDRESGYRVLVSYRRNA